MALTSGFFNGIDRKYNAEQLSSLFDGVIKDGVFATIGEALAVTASSDMDLIIGTGRAWFDKTWSYNDTEYPIAISESELILDRIDAVVLEVNKNEELRTNSFKIVKGTPSSNPSNPELIKSELVNQYPLAYVRVKGGATSISQANIKNAVGTSETPFVTGILQTISIDMLVSQWGVEWSEWSNEKQNEFLLWITLQESDFDSWSQNRKQEFDLWFDTVQNTLDGDTAGNLYNLINDRVPKGATWGDIYANS